MNINDMHRIADTVALNNPDKPNVQLAAGRFDLSVWRFAFSVSQKLGQHFDAGRLLGAGADTKPPRKGK